MMLKVSKKSFTLGMALAVLAGALAICPVTALAATSTFNLTTGAGTGQASDYAWSDPILTVNHGADIEITGTVNSGRRIEVAAGATAAITLSNVSITGLGSNQCPLLLNTGANVTLILADGSINTLTAGTSAAGIQTTDATLTIEGGIAGTGSLIATGNASGAGIGGGGGGGAGGTITINGGSVTASSSGIGAGIGGGNGGAGGTITINGGDIIASGNASGAGIGGGSGGAGGSITINGGNISATGGSSGAGIGGGGSGVGGSITITGGKINATGSGGGAGIGGGRGFNSGGASGGVILITGGSVTATGSVGSTPAQANKGGSGGGAGIGGGGGNNGTVLDAITPSQPGGGIPPSPLPSRSQTYHRPGLTPSTQPAALAARATGRAARAGPA